MQWQPKCPKERPVSHVCLSHSCPYPPFQCGNLQCVCGPVHVRCKSMHWKSVRDYLIDWKKNVCKEGQQFMSRVGKIFGNLRSRLEREQKIFQQFCKEGFLGKDYDKLMYLLQKRDQKQITTQLLSCSLRNLTEPTGVKKFSNFTLSQMQLIDKNADQLFVSLQKLYRSKQQPQLDRMKRCSSAVLQRTQTNSSVQKKAVFESQVFGKSEFSEFVNIKLDLSFPRALNSKILAEATALNKLLNLKVKKYHLTYRASENNFNIQRFYNLMNVTQQHLTSQIQKGKHKMQLLSVLIFRTEFGKILGGVTPLKWQQSKQAEDSEDEANPESKSERKYKTDPSAKTALFSLDLMERYDLQHPNEAIYCGRRSIGFGRGDLRVIDKCNSVRKSSCKFPVSYNYRPRPYTDWSKSGMDLCGGRYSSLFRVVEWEGFLLEC